MKINSVEDVKIILEKIDVVCPDSDLAYYGKHSEYILENKALQSRIDERTRLMYDAAQACEFLLKLLGGK